LLRTLTRIFDRRFEKGVTGSRDSKIKEKAMPTIHDFRDHVLGCSTGKVYDLSQTTDGVHDGDVLIAQENGLVIFAIMVEAWPTVFGMAENAGAFHDLAPGINWISLGDGKYEPSIKLIDAWEKEHPDVEVG
jgi:hypothetical protein